MKGKIAQLHKVDESETGVVWDDMLSLWKMRIRVELDQLTIENEKNQQGS